MIGYLFALALIPAAVFSAWISYKVKERKRKRLLRHTHDTWNW